MSMASTDEQDRSDYLKSYRERDVDDTLADHEVRITDNERRWLFTKGALATLATVKGIDFVLAEIGVMF